ncbi:adenosylcobinamide-phosphate synthase CbiB [Aestuariivirga sp.]|uniref:adenosylcobinamide-phosphate synthase CbiB n=1 Tax=Aestuariivirga sp. TaxID=2650926 RepID=UPI00391B8E37
MDWPVLVFGRAAVALLVERFVGYPDRVFQSIGHPVVWAGKLITILDQRFNASGASAVEGRVRGTLALALLVAAAFLPSYFIARLLADWPLGWLVEALLATTLIAHKSLKDHVLAVYNGLGRSLPEARRAVSMIVGRDPSELDESGIAKAALESLAENASDGIVAPALWYALLGLPGIAVYKAINTADSMIGHKNERYQWFGWAAAKLDDLVNLPASRLTGYLIAATEPSRFREIVTTMRRDAPKHQSPNAGWPEAAMAAALGLRFGGPRSYQGERVDLPYMGDGRDVMTRKDIAEALQKLSKTLWLLLFLLSSLSLVT